MKPKSFFARYLRFFVFALAAVLLVELGALVYLDRSMLVEKTDVSVKAVMPSSTSKPASLHLRLDSDAKGLQVSYQGVYIAYLSGGALKILNITNGKIMQVAMAKNMTASCYRWLYDRNRLILAEKANGGYDVKLYSLDMGSTGSASATLVPDEIMNNSGGGTSPKEAKIELGSLSTAVSDIEFSTSTVITYVKVTSKSGSRVWKLNFPSEPSRYSLYTGEIGQIQCLKNMDELLYEDKANGRVYVAGKGPLSIGGKTKFQLLGFDGADNVYLAAGNGDTADTVYYGSLQSEDGSSVDLEPKLKKAELSTPAKIDRMFVTISGGLFVDDRTDHYVQDVISGSETSYSGDIVAAYATGIITEKDGELGQKSLS